jgi:hypothetical protein
MKRIYLVLVAALSLVVSAFATVTPATGSQLRAASSTAALFSYCDPLLSAHARLFPDRAWAGSTTLARGGGTAREPNLGDVAEDLPA